MKRNVQNTNKGITLVALVITIIVLLILAGVAINMAINSGGLFGKANEAVDQYGEARKNESTAISDLFDKLTEIETGIKVEQVTDAKPGELEGTGTEVDPYTINSIEDLVFFSQNVRNGNTYAGEYVKLGLSLDFNSNKSYVEPLRTDYAEYGYDGELKILLTTGEGFKPIGQNDFTDGDDTTKLFAGTFDGNGKIILNLYINIARKEQIIKVGLFSQNRGTIKNLGLNVSIQMRNIILNSHLGSIAGQNGKIGIIEKCYANGKIVASTTSVGGITGFCAGTIKDCYNSINIVSDMQDEINEDVFIGGIASQLSGNGTINNCYNIGKLEYSSSGGRIKIGGLAGLNNGTITSSYNKGEIFVTLNNASLLQVGGIAGRLENQSVANIDKCYSVGDLRIEYDEIEVLRKGGVCGSISEGTISDCYYLSNIADVGVGHGTGTATAIEKESDMPSILSVVGEAFKEDTNNINNGYPILDWQ